MTKIKPDQLDKMLAAALKSTDEDIQKKTNLAIRQTAIAVWSSIIKETPVQDGYTTQRKSKRTGELLPRRRKKVKGVQVTGGRTRGNWFIDTIAGNRLELAVPDKKKGEAYVKSKMPKWVLGVRVYLFNNMPNI